MLESIRKYQKILMGLLLLLILPSFVFLGVETYMQDIGKDSALVKVNGAAITRQELDNAVKLRIVCLLSKPFLMKSFSNASWLTK
jgi:hypothetical protein